MNLSEFKDALESDATKKCKEQEKEIAKLRCRIQKLQHEKKCLFNRCRTLFGRNETMCVFCNMRTDCENTRTIQKMETRE